MGPRFLPPTYTQIRKRNVTPVYQPTTAYLKPLNIIHPVYFDNISQCPKCDSTNTHWDGWTTTGHRDLHGVREEETALGYQLNCKDCESQHRDSHTKGGKDSYCFATTNVLFWEKWEHWAIPRQHRIVHTSRVAHHFHRRHTVFPQALRCDLRTL